jgi:hypothetical protein
MIYLLYLILAIVVIIPTLAVGLGLLFKVDKGLRHFSDGTTIQHYDLPSWLKWFSNPIDGLTGDRRGWYWNIYMEGKPAWLKMFWWSAFRNQYNYLKRYVIGIDMREYVVTKIAGQDVVRDSFEGTGFHILKATPDDGGWNKYTLYWVMRWFKSNRAIVVQLGWKIKLSHNGMHQEDESKYWKGFTIEPNPFKDIS